MTGDRCGQCGRYIPPEAASGRELLTGVCDDCYAMRKRATASIDLGVALADYTDAEHAPPPRRTEY